MTKLEFDLSRCRWVWTGYNFTTVKNGYGFVIYRAGNQMWLAVLSKKLVAQLQAATKTEGEYITGFTSGFDNHPSKCMIVIPATPELLSYVMYKVMETDQDA